MAKYLEPHDLRAWIYLDEGVDDEKIDICLSSAETAVDNDLDKASLDDYVNADTGKIPAPLFEAILISAGQSYAAPDDMLRSGVTLMRRYDRLIKPYVRH